MPFRLKYRGMTFGGESDSLVVTEELTPPTFDLRNEYQDKLGADGQLASRDWVGAGSWQMTIISNLNDLASGVDAFGALEQLWRDRSVRNSTATVPLDYSLNDGETWFRVYGRPGQWTSLTDGDGRVMQGVVTGDVEFKQLDPAHYSAAEHRVVIPVVPASHGGIVAPLVAPITTVASGEPRVGGIDNAGDLSSPARVVFHGPCTNPVLTTDKGYKIGYVGSIAYDQTVTISAWDSTIIKTPPRASVAGDLDRRTRLSRLVVPSGHSEWYFEATDATGTASATVYWRDAYTAMQH